MARGRRSSSASSPDANGVTIRRGKCRSSTARFGHCELRYKGSLRDSIGFFGWKPDDPRVTVVRQERCNLLTGALIDPYE
jgi:hypothetical protein